MDVGWGAIELLFLFLTVCPLRLNLLSLSFITDHLFDMLGQVAETWFCIPKAGTSDLNFWEQIISLETTNHSV